MGRKLAAAAVVTVLTLLSVAATLPSLRYRRFLVRTTFVSEAPMELDQVSLNLVPSVPGWQKLVGWSMFIDGRPEYCAKTLGDGDGNTLVDVSCARRAHNLTLVQVVDVATRLLPGFRSVYTPDNPLVERVPYDPPVTRFRPPVKPGNDLGFIRRLVEWVLSNIRYESVFDRIDEPEKVVERGSGNCGDQAYLIVTSARAVGLKGYVYFAAVFKPGVNSFTGNRVSAEYRNVVLHAFAMISLDGEGWFPVDTTAKKRGSSFDSATRGALVNQFDGIILLKRAVNRDPGEASVVKLPSSRSMVHYSLEIVDTGSVEKALASLGIMLLISALAGVLAYLVLGARSPEPPSAVRTEHVNVTEW